MRMKLLVLFCVFSSFLSFGQNMENHLWKHRVLLIYTEDAYSKVFENQIRILKDQQKELDDRKLVIYSFTKEAYIYYFKNTWKKSSELFLKFNPKNAPFKVVLIGLDGGIKLEQTEILSKEKLFAVIDGMPMRKRELQRESKIN